jgi:hypothetical protein
LDDHWDFILDVQKWYDGTWQMSDLWKQHNEHRLVIPRLFFLTDVFLFRGSNAFLVTTNVVIQFLHVLLLWYVSARTRLAPPARWAVAIATPLFLFSAANLENFVWAFQTQFVLVFFAVSAACVALLQLSSSPRLSWLILTLVMGAVATFSLANGLLIWPILIGLAVVSGLGWQTTAVVTVAGLAIGGLCLLSFTPHPGHASPFESLLSPLTVFRYAALYLSGPFGSLCGYRPGIALGSLGMLLTMGLALEAIRHRRQLPPARFALLGITGFIVASAFVTALGRINFPLEQALSARYMTPVLIYWVATIVACLAKRPTTLWWRQPLVGLGAGLLAVLSTMLIPQQVAETKRWTMRTDKIKIATAALLVNVQDDEAVRFTYPAPYRAWLGAEVLRTHALSVYSGPLATLLGHSLGDAVWVVPSEQCPGAIDPAATVSVAPGERGGFRVSGWVDTRECAFSPEVIALVSETGTIVGLGTISLAPHYAAAKNGRLVSTWTGYVADRFQARQVAAYAVSLDTALTACRLAGEVRAPSLTVPFTALGTPLNGLGVLMTGGWSVNGQHPAGGVPPVNATVYGSWSGGDENTGTLRLGPFTAGDHKAIGVPLVTGPDVSNLSARLIDQNSGRTLARLESLAFLPHRWVVWKIDLPAGAGATPLVFVFEDAGSAWGQWFAVATPFWLMDQRRPLDTLQRD